MTSDEVRVTWFLWDYSSTRIGDGKITARKSKSLSAFFYGSLRKNPSHIQMLSEGKLKCVDLHFTADALNVTKKSSWSKNSKSTITCAYLKHSMKNDERAAWCVGVDATYRDFRLKNRSGNTSLVGCQLEGMTKKGLKDYRKAIAFASNK